MKLYTVDYQYLDYLKEKDNLISIVGNIVGEVDVVERENKNGEAFKVANFSVVSKDDEGNKVYHNCSAYGEKVIFQKTLIREILLSTSVK